MPVTNRLFFRPHQQDRNGGAMPDFMNGAAENKVAQKAMAVSGHGNQIAMFPFRGLDDFPRRIAECQMGRYVQACGTQVRGGLFEIFPVDAHFLRFGELEVVEVSGDPSVGDMNQEEFRTGHLSQGPHMRKQAGIGSAVFESNQDLSIHTELMVESAVPQEPYLINPRTKSINSFAFRQIMIAATVQATILIHPRLTNSPIL